ncbi:MAG: hypothetical protein IPL28_24250 [Chloroflexi bacterium]|nr:hypothetical protein [Chloroflexota bacterium]
MHQFRGRVGRGQHQSYRLLIADDSRPEAEARAGGFEQTNDGFNWPRKPRIALPQSFWPAKAACLN